MTFNEDDLDRLADYAAGLLDPAEEAEVAALVAADPAWAATYEQLVAADAVVATHLREEPGEAMPADVAARLDAALKVEDVAGAVARTPISLNEARRRRQRRAGLVAVGAVAAALVAIVGGSVVNGSLPSGESSTAADAPAAGGAPHAAPEAAASSAGPDGNAQFRRESTAPATVQGDRTDELASVPVFSSDTDYTWATLSLAVIAEATDGDAAKASVPVPAPLAALAAPATLRGCLDAIGAATGGTPLRAEFASYEGTPALVVVVTRPGGQTVAVAGGACRAGDADLRGRRDLP
ncbi:hypothetical protein [Luedemannella helvata]|uniref:Anti-sigma factor n=1 Tax=Luedemannella helvata TaxID=349315 RepID=A0ABP4XAU5_9ACTN